MVVDCMFLKDYFDASYMLSSLMHSAVNVKLGHKEDRPLLYDNACILLME